MDAEDRKDELAEDRNDELAEGISKKDQITSLFLSGMTEIEDLALVTNTRPSYVASVLRDAGFTREYFDLYTSTRQPMNVYSKFFAGKLGFKDLATARRSVDLIDRMHRRFQLAGDRAGQHHALVMALTMFDRARWTRKAAEAEVFRQWLMQKLAEAEPVTEETEPVRRGSRVKP